MNRSRCLIARAAPEAGYTATGIRTPALIPLGSSRTDVQAGSPRHVHGPRQVETA